ncbi:MAG: M23 family metallopeptidase [Prolixibacteraceae bacterium]|nr:M23 family metallopeptidase [Prolixibacteraceae bacterium]
MGGTKYRFNPETLTYEKVHQKLTGKMLAFLSFFAVTLIVAAGIASLFISHFETPEVKALQQENEQLLSQYLMLNEKLAQVEHVLDEIQVRDDNIYRVIFESDPIPESVRKAGFGGTNSYEGLESYDPNQLVLNTTKKLDIISKQAYIQAKSYQDVLSLAMSKEAELSSTPAIMPIASTDLSFTSSGWGMRRHPIYKVPMFHFGIDFVAPRGTNVYATGDGVVKAVRTERTGHGRHVVIDHGFGYESLYAHLKGFNVKAGQHIKRGEVIGFVGSTGTSTAPHLHYEVLKDGKNVDPKHYFFKDLTPAEFEELVAQSSNIGRSFD